MFSGRSFISGRTFRSRDHTCILSQYPSGCSPDGVSAADERLAYIYEMHRGDPWWQPMSAATTPHI